MPYELYFRDGVGRRLRWITNAAKAGMQYLGGLIYTNGYTYVPPITINITPADALPLTGDGTLYSKIIVSFSAPTDKAYTATLGYNIGAGAKTRTIAIPKGTTQAAAMALIAGASVDAGLTLSNTTAQVRATPANAVVLTAFTLAFA